ncbi:MAG TPA: hypothetical protein VG605_23600, partial [Puia sp.]|nr:hypothetical protein [Puia sp.]
MKSMGQDTTGNVFFSWSQAKAVPDADGFAGSYAGVSNGALLVAGGANFPGGGRPWSGGVKKWYDNIFVLESPGGRWKEAGRLPRPMGYGVSLTYQDGVVCLGGGDAERNYADVFILKYTGGSVKVVPLPAMPGPVINACGAIVGHKLYIAGGIATPTGLTTNSFWCMDLSDADTKWQVLASFPGPSRMLAVAGAQDDNFYLFGGVHLAAEPGAAAGSTPQREYLKDCWTYMPDKGWKRIADLPHPVAAAPSPAYNAGQSHLMLFGGDDGGLASQVAVLKDEHPGFRNELLAYNTLTDSWSVMGKIPVDKKADAVANTNGSVYAPVTTPLVVWNGNIVLTGGEVRPAVRTNKVLIAAPRQPSGKFGGLD